MIEDVKIQSKCRITSGFMGVTCSVCGENNFGGQFPCTPEERSMGLFRESGGSYAPGALLREALME